MIKEDVLMSGGNHVIVEHAQIDGNGILLRKNHAIAVELMAPCDGHTGFDGLSGRVAVAGFEFTEGSASVDEEVNG